MNTLHARKFGDIRDTTVDTRTDIGFKNKESWANAPATFDEHTLTIQGHPVMEDWEDSYMRALACIACRNGGTVLEVGYGMGISARYIQKHPIDRHIVIEANDDVFEQLSVFARSAPRSVSPLFGFWEDLTTSLPDGSVDGILFDTYPLSAEEIHTNHFPFFEEAHRLLSSGGVLTYYSDEINEFSPRHLELLNAAGFTDINKNVCPVSPPADCAYWKSETIVAPIIRKA